MHYLRNMEIKIRPKVINSIQVTFHLQIRFIMTWPFKQSPEVYYAVPVYKYLIKIEEIGPWNFGQFAEIFQRGEDNCSPKHLIHLQKA